MFSDAQTTRDFLGVIAGSIITVTSLSLLLIGTPLPKLECHASISTYAITMTPGQTIRALDLPSVQSEGRDRQGTCRPGARRSAAAVMRPFSRGPRRSVPGIAGHPAGRSGARSGKRVRRRFLQLSLSNDTHTD